MREIANIELYCVCKELQAVVGARLEKVYEVGKDEFRLRFRSPTAETDVFCRLKERIHITQYIKEAPQKPSDFAMGLRKYIEGARVKSVMQYGLDRVIVFELEKQKTFLLIFEMFSHGNLILTDNNYKITHSYRAEEWKDRKIKRGEKYNFPHSERIDPFELNEQKLVVLLDSKKLVPSLSSKINLSPSYTEEACRRAKIDLERRADSLTEAEVRELFAGFIEVIEHVNKPQPTIYISNGSYVDYSIFPFKKYEKTEKINFKSLSALLDDFYLHCSEEKEEYDEVEFRLKQQERYLNELREKAKENKEAGDLIYSNFDKVEAILSFIKERRKKSLEQITEELREQMPEEAKLVESIDLKKGKVALHL